MIIPDFIRCADSAAKCLKGFAEYASSVREAYEMEELADDAVRIAELLTELVRLAKADGLASELVRFACLASAADSAYRADELTRLADGVVNRSVGPQYYDASFKKIAQFSGASDENLAQFSGRIYPIAARYAQLAYNTARRCYSRAAIDDLVSKLPELAKNPDELTGNVGKKLLSKLNKIQYDDLTNFGFGDDEDNLIYSELVKIGYGAPVGELAFKLIKLAHDVATGNLVEDIESVADRAEEMAKEAKSFAKDVNDKTDENGEFLPDIEGTIEEFESQASGLAFSGEDIRSDLGSAGTVATEVIRCLTKESDGCFGSGVDKDWIYTIRLRELGYFF